MDRPDEMPGERALPEHRDVSPSSHPERFSGHRGTRPKSQIAVVRSDQFLGQSIGFGHHSRIGGRRWRRDRKRRRGESQQRDKTDE
jgi:hypothetical protein